MATIDLKLKTYEQLQFEVMNLSTKNYLQQQKLDKYKNIVDELERYIKIDAKIEIYGDKTGLRTFVDGQDLLDKLKELKGSDE